MSYRFVFGVLKQTAVAPDTALIQADRLREGLVFESG